MLQTWGPINPCLIEVCHNSTVFDINLIRAPFYVWFWLQSIVQRLTSSSRGLGYPFAYVSLFTSLYLLHCNVPFLYHYNTLWGPLTDVPFSLLLLLRAPFLYLDLVTVDRSAVDLRWCKALSMSLPFIEVALPPFPPTHIK